MTSAKVERPSIPGILSNNPLANLGAVLVGTPNGIPPKADEIAKSLPAFQASNGGPPNAADKPALTA